MATGLLLVGSVAGGVGDAPALQVVQAEALLGSDDSSLDRGSDEAMPGRVEARLTE